MSDDRSRAPDGPIDQAIDRAVRDRLTGEPPADLRARVLARLEEPATAAAWWSPGRIVTVAAAVAVSVVVAYLAWPSRPAPVAEPTAVVAEARPPAAPPTEAPAPAEVASPGAAVRTVRASAMLEPAPYEFRSPRGVSRLDAPALIEIHPMPPDTIDVDPVAVEPLAFERLTIEPLGVSR